MQVDFAYPTKLLCPLGTDVRMLPLEEIQAQALAEEVLNRPPEIGYLTISNALQWRLQYSRVIQQAGTTSGIERL